MNSFEKSILQYWQSSLIEEDRPKLDNQAFKTASRISSNSISKGQIDPETMELFWENKFRNKGSKNKELTPEETEVIVCPYIFKSRNYGDRDGIEYLTPILIPAALSREGSLAAVETSPWIPRELLEPNNSNHLIIGSLKDADQYLKEAIWSEKRTSWEEVLNYGQKLIKAVAGKSIHDLEIEEFSLLDGGLFLAKPDDFSPSTHLINLYKQISKKEIELPLLQRLLRKEDGEDRSLLSDFERRSFRSFHFGQMGSRNPLSPDQRNAFLHLTTTKESEIFALNGPPGTGKTTLLQNVIASLWTEAALSEQEKDPPIIVATSANNQAVTNIIESFNQQETDKQLPLNRRWLPELKSFGLYCVSTGKSDAQTQNKFQIISPKEPYFFQNLEKNEYIEKSEKFFLEKFKECFHQENSSLEEAKIFLKKELRKLNDASARGIELDHQFIDVQEAILKHDHRFNRFWKKAKTNLERNKEVRIEVSKASVLTQEIDQHYSSLPWWMRLFRWLPFVQKRINRDLVDFLAFHEIKFEPKMNGLREFHQWNDHKLLLLGNHILLCEQWQEWCRDHHIPQDPKDLDDELDVKVRYQAFWIATHYWEARWLLEMKEQFKMGYLEGQARIKQEIKWKRYAKLTPCFVSTLFMVPKFFHAWEEEPSFLIITLLIC